MKTCEGPGCRKKFAPRGRKRFCSDRCRFRAHQSPDRGRSKQAPPKITSFLAQTTREELERTRRVMTPAGQSALILAQRIDAVGATETGAALAAMIREHSAALERATREGEPDDPVRAARDEVTRRRERRAAG